MEYKSNQHRQMATVKNILSQIFFPKRQELSSHEPYSGSCGTRAQWNLNPENEELRITGTGPLFDFFGEKEVPWESHLDHIRKVVVAHGITYIGFQAFSYCTSLSSVELPDTLTARLCLLQKPDLRLSARRSETHQGLRFCALLPLAGTHPARHTQKYRQSRFLFLPRPYPHIHTRQCHPARKRSVRRLQKPDGNKAPRRTVATQKQ